MNKTELQMVEVLLFLEQNGAVSVKAEFEAEGTRIDELLRLVDVSRSTNLKLTLKIGGCEAMKDLMDAKQIGANFIVAPMVESVYALEKFALSRDKVYDAVEKQGTQFLVNLETITAFNNQVNLIEAAQNNRLDGIVFGRVDFSGSLGLSREQIESKQITDSILSTAALCSEANLGLVVGGAISYDSLQALQEIKNVHLTRFETRKIVFTNSMLDYTPNEIQDILKKAVHFELLWLINKREYYGRIHTEDAKRIEMLESRWKVL